MGGQGADVVSVYRSIGLSVYRTYVPSASLRRPRSAGANEPVLVGRLLADKIGGLIKRA